jgi:hypothetical protein
VPAKEIEVRKTNRKDKAKIFFMAISFENKKSPPAR